MAAFEGQTVAITDSERPLFKALADAFASEGAAVYPIQQGDDITARPVDTLVVLPPLLPPQPTLDVSDTDWSSAVETALSRSFRLIKAAGVGMVARRQGCILVIGKLTASTGWPGYALSSAVHGALLALTRSLACEWAAHNVRVVYLSCGAIEGELAVPGDLSPQFSARTPLGRSAAPEEITQAALYLASASFTTGTEFRADGGWSAWGLLK
jgi:NAD(P)-dependent dehydrogenase (short-subunit alcohol dehydrogenase family)